ncbi:hypothetical protein V502_00354 [Pseudogymnoascus sp. VKM F-4520 (FW-2644)]|nr:hypothetical protein V502_00354 [Pseudogymnoascus sp. VKM F-4520 (FW-2644)]
MAFDDLMVYVGYDWFLDRQAKQPTDESPGVSHIIDVIHLNSRHNLKERGRILLQTSIWIDNRPLQSKTCHFWVFGLDHAAKMPGPTILFGLELGRLLDNRHRIRRQYDDSTTIQRQRDLYATLHLGPAPFVSISLGSAWSGIGLVCWSRKASRPFCKMPDRTSNDVKPLKVIIIGASIGGLALTQLLMSAPGIHVTCYERSDGVDDRLIGFRVMLSGSTLAMLERKLSKEAWAHLALGIGEAPEGGEKIEFFKGNGDKMFVWDSDPMKDQFAVSTWQLRQALLHRAEPVLRVCHAFERYEPLPKGGARVYFTNGTTDECDLVVGADGWDSNVRKQLIPNAAIKDGDPLSDQW